MRRGIRFTAVPSVRRVALVLLLCVGPACTGDTAFDPNLPPSRIVRPARVRLHPAIPAGTIPHSLQYTDTDWLGDSLLAAGDGGVSIDHRLVSTPVRWSLKSSWSAVEDARAHLARDLQLLWFTDRWKSPVQMRREGDRLVGVDAFNDSLYVELPPGAQFFTDLSLVLLFASWPLAPGWEQTGLMNESRHSNRPVPVRIRIVGDESIATAAGVFDCWIVAVHGPPDRAREPHWYWVSKDDQIVVMRRRYLRRPRGAIEERLLQGYWSEPKVVIPFVAQVPPSSDEDHSSAIIRISHAAGGSRYQVLHQGYDADTLVRFEAWAGPDRILTGADSATIVRALQAHGVGFRVGSPTDDTFLKVPRERPSGR